MLKPEEIERKIELGQIYVKEGNPQEALKYLRDAFSEFGEGQKIPAELLSLYGYSMAMAKGRINEGIILCTKALNMDPDEPSYYLNLGKIYLRAGNKASAVKVFKRGLMSDKKNLEILLELKRLGIRRRPLMPLLPRRHPVNKFLGKVTAKLPEK